MFARFPLKITSIKLIHENCWTSIADNIKLKSVGMNYYPDKNVLRALLLGDKKSISELMKLENKEMFRIQNLTKNAEHSYILDITQNYDNSVYRLLTQHGLFIINTIKINGYEIWNLIGYEYQISRAIRDLDNIGKIEGIITINNNNDIIEDNTKTDLTENEIKILMTAVKLGYFDYPRKVKTKEIAEILGISESTFLYHIRKIQSKMVRKLISNFLNDSA